MKLSVANVLAVALSGGATAQNLRAGSGAAAFDEASSYLGAHLDEEADTTFHMREHQGNLDEHKKGRHGLHGDRGRSKVFKENSPSFGEDGYTDFMDKSDLLMGGRQLSGHLDMCCFEGQCREPGQWLQGPEKTCMCHRNGSGEWTKCFKNGRHSTDKPKEQNTAFSRLQRFKASDFVYDLLGSVPDSITPAGTIQPLTVAELPSLEGQGVSFSLFNIEPCGINLPHTHPRATELLYVIKGEKLRTAFVEENGDGSGAVVNDIGTGEATFFPMGLIHYQQNLSCETATYISALNSADPGVSTVTTRFFELPSEALEGSLGESRKTVQKLIDGLPMGPAEGRQECMKKCGLW